MDAHSLPPDLEAQVYEIALDPGAAAAETREGSIDALCAAHPEYAEGVRALLSRLADADRLITPPSSEPTGSTVPSRLGEYDIVREAGRGGMGIVFEAWQSTLRRSVALKILPGQFGFPGTAVERFRREGAAGARLRHEGIVEVFGFGEDSGHYFLAMEFVEGAPLDRVLEESIERGEDGATVWSPDRFAAVVANCAHQATHPEATAAPLPPATWPQDRIQTMVAIVAQVAAALAHAHRAGIVHRDVKPSNILLRPDGRAVLTDFGLARDAELPSLTISGQFTGTPHYASPEQAAGNRSLDRRSDVFSLGAMLYEMVTHATPFSGESSQEVLSRIQRSEPVDPQRVRPEISPDLAAVILHAMEKDPEQRYPTAAAFEADLQALLSQRSVSARRASRWTRARRWVRREPLWATIGALLLVGVPTIAVLVGVSIANAPKVAAAEAMERQQRLESMLTAGQIRLGSRDYGGARESFRAALEINATSAEACAGHGYAQYAAGDTDDARVFLAGLTPAMRQHPAVARVILWTEGARDSEDVEARAKAAAAARHPFELTLLAEEESRRGNATADFAASARARLLFRAALRASERARPWIHSRLAQLAGAAEDAVAVRELTRAMERLWPREIFTLEAIALAHVRLDPELAIRTATEGLARHETAQLYLARSHAHFERLGNRSVRRGGEAWDAAVAAALADCRTAYEMDPKRVSTLGHLSRIHYQAGQYDAALVAADRALAKNPTHQLYLWQRAHSLSRLRRPSESMAAWERALRIYPNWDQAWNNLANVALSAGDASRALEAARRAVALKPDYVIGICTLGEALIEKKEWAEARDTFEKCVALAPRDSYSHEQIAKLLIRDDVGEVRDTTRALVAARRVSALAKERLKGPGVRAELLLGKVLLAAGQRDLAKTTLGALRAMIEKSTNPRAKAYLKSVDALLRRAAK